MVPTPAPHSSRTASPIAVFRLKPTAEPAVPHRAIRHIASTNHSKWTNAIDASNSISLARYTSDVYPTGQTDFYRSIEIVRSGGWWIAVPPFRTLQPPPSTPRTIPTLLIPHAPLLPQERWDTHLSRARPPPSRTKKIGTHQLRPLNSWRSIAPLCRSDARARAQTTRALRTGTPFHQPLERVRPAFCRSLICKCARRNPAA